MKSMQIFDLLFVRIYLLFVRILYLLFGYIHLLFVNICMFAYIFCVFVHAFCICKYANVHEKIQKRNMHLLKHPHSRFIVHQQRLRKFSRH